MEKKKYIVYYNDEVNEPAEVFTADTLIECEDWISDQVEGKTPVNDNDSEDVINSAKTFSFEVYEGDMIELINGVAIFNDFCYASDYYYND